MLQLDTNGRRHAKCVPLTAKVGWYGHLEFLKVGNKRTKIASLGDIAVLRYFMQS